MQQFNEYINKVVGKLNISKKYKLELSEEFRDHLNMLKKELMESGLTEQAATEEAIRQFGNSNVIKTKLAGSISGYRTLSNIVFGILFTFLLYFGASRVPVPGYTSWDQINIQIFVGFAFFANFFILLVPFGYFFPIFFKRAGRVLYVAVGALLFTPGVMSLLVMDFWGLDTEYLVVSILGGLMGTLLGFGILKIINSAFEKVRSLKTI